MADAGTINEERLQEIIECPICMSTFTDPRMLPCFHTFCFQCLKSTSEAAKKKPGDKMPCPLCRKEFMIPVDGVNGVQKNFFMENLLECKTLQQVGGETIICDMCNIINVGKTGKIRKATMRCLECQDNYCESCVKVHKFQKVNKDHQMVKIGSVMKSETKRIVSMKSCTTHVHKPLDYYCVSCFDESHKLHDCKDMTTVDEDFRREIEMKASKISTHVNEILIKRKYTKKRSADFLTEIDVTEKEIFKRNQELKDMIDRHTQSLLDELSVIKSNHLKEMETRLEEIDIRCAMLMSFETYCTELRSKGSASDICSSVDQIIVRAAELDRDQETFFGCPYQSTKVTFKATDLGDHMQKANSNFLGTVEEILSSRQLNSDTSGDLLSIQLFSALKTGKENSIWGVAYLRNVIYLLSKSTKLILAFDAEVPFRMLKTIPVPQIETPQDLAACKTHNCLYVVDVGRKCVWKVTCTETKVNLWFTGIGDPFKISVAKGGRVLIPREGRPCTIEIMRSDVTLIKLPDEIKDIEHVLQSNSETLIILYGQNRRKNSGIMEISMDGVVLKTHSINMEVLSEISDPRHMTLCRGNTPLVADCRNDRVIAFDSKLKGNQIILSKPENKIHKPYRVCYIEDRKYLIFVHRFGYDVVVYKCI